MHVLLLTDIDIQNVIALFWCQHREAPLQQFSKNNFLLSRFQFP